MQQVSQRPVVPPSPLSLVTFTESMTTGAWPRGWPTPSCDVIASLATITGNPNLTLAAIAGMTRTQFSALCSEKRWLAGHQISYAAFRLIAVATGMVEHVVIPQRIVPLRPEIFQADATWLPPNNEECLYLASRCGLGEKTYDTKLAVALGLTFEVVHNMRLNKNSKASVVPVDKELWFKLLHSHDIFDAASCTKAPDLFPETLLPFNAGFRPVLGSKLRNFLYWTGYSFAELAFLIGVEPDHLHQLTSASAKSNLTFMYYDRWRLLLETFGIVQPVTSVMCCDKKVRDVQRVQ